ncbi:PTS mannitol transporter subunit IICB [Cryobacterium sp. TMT1-3]|uniref:PTS system mannitol-specific EIICB component n=1 Tax=Cryobacterium luteum TaxID=1424661 RepID=A0A1H8C6W9_9MICO|nr:MULTISPECIES: PTS mannitol transporter subunit IICB [Cryobacterium]TFB89247.1 PTS mannitol transporter subunit IICB [Cryobacterium luteum]TFC27443.1 PTS mannitol transporter subunit IICB [Cryobacterium sp. TMT1-3]SEM90018.1 PTS system D-mannitol-specific IIA component, Fru family /PTS system D-mannitol-specific IIB component, Fru family /PTS system D-mannitol-specific IIC component, Fru family [Cryobacterium luteum]
MTTTSADPQRPGTRVHVQRFGTFLSGMVMPNIPAFIAWGLITALFISTGWLPNGILGGFGDADAIGWQGAATALAANEDGSTFPQYVGLVGPMITYLLPLLIANTGGRMVYDTRGGVIATIATMGVIVGSQIPMFIGAMIVGPLAAWLLKKVDSIWDGKIKPGFEMLIDNFSAGILGALLAIGAFFGIAPVVTWLSSMLEAGVDWLINAGLLPLASILIEPGKVLFLNNAINHGVLTPLGVQQVEESGKSLLFLLEANPGPGLGILLAYTFFGLGIAKASAPGAIIIQFLGGIHEIYFPYVLMKPLLILAAIGGGMTGVAVNVAFQTGLRAPASPGSIFAVLFQTAPDSYFGVILSVAAAAGVSFLIAAVILRASRKRDLAAGSTGDLGAAVAQTEAYKGKSSSVLGGLAGQADAAPAPVGAGRPLHNIVFACDAGMGSSAMGASVLRNKMKKAGIEGVTVVNKSIANLDGSADLVITHQDLTDRARSKSPNSVHVSVENFMNSPRYDEVVELIKSNDNEVTR